MWRRANGEIHLGSTRFRYEAISAPAPAKDHDGYLISDDFVAVADGLTPVEGGSAEDLRRYVHRLLLNLENKSASSNAREALRQTVRVVGSAFPGSISMTPTCALAFVRAHNEAIEEAVAGDCTIVIHMRNGDVLRVDDSRMGAFDSVVIRDIAERMQKGAGYEQALADALPQLRANRAAANRAETYWVIGNDDRVADELVCQSHLLDEVDALLVCTDGFARLVDLFRTPADCGDLIREAASLGLHDLMSRLRTMERRIKSLSDYPRLGRFDDATAVYLY
jgi:hypothetical protein